MSKYTCNKCGENAHYIDFYKASDAPHPESIYAYCKGCGREAWGGMKFHPAMNELFNDFFKANFDHPNKWDLSYEDKQILQK